MGLNASASVKLQSQSIGIMPFRSDRTITCLSTNFYVSCLVCCQHAVLRTVEGKVSRVTNFKSIIIKKFFNKQQEIFLPIKLHYKSDNKSYYKSIDRNCFSKRHSEDSETLYFTSSIWISPDRFSCSFSDKTNTNSRSNSSKSNSKCHSKYF